MVSAMHFLQVLAAGASLASARALPFGLGNVVVSQEHFEVLRLRANTPANPSAVHDVTCLDSQVKLVSYDENIAQLAICNGISGSSTTKCAGKPTSTQGKSGNVVFSLTTTDEGATINISKTRWEQCIRAARGVCPTGSLRAVCSGGASRGDVAFTLGTADADANELR